ncbi:MAG: TIGR03089 family protein [Dermatophilaceae bacterium]
MRPDHLLPHLLRSDPARPRITCYDDRTGERIELSARVLNNWVAKAANLLQEQFDAGPGTVVAIDLPPHWRTLYWTLAAWATGATVSLPPPATPDVLVTTDPAAPTDAPLVVVTLAALARRATSTLPADAVDEARELAGFPDTFGAFQEAADSDLALVAAGESSTYADLAAYVRVTGMARARVHTETEDLETFLRLAIRTYAADGSLVLTVGGPAPADRLRAEGVAS